jgi:hypothetical protein
MVHKPTQKLVLVIFMTIVFGSVLPPVNDVDAEDRTLDLASPLQAQSIIPPTSSFVLYSRNVDHNDYLPDTIWLMDATGDHEIMDGMYPRLSPDGRYIVYKKGHTLHARSDIYVRDLQTGLDTRIFINTNYVISYWWTADSSKIVFDYYCGVYIMDRNGANMQLLSTGWPFPYPCSNDAPSLNPVDGRIAWHNDWIDGGLGVADSDGSNSYHVSGTVRYDYSPVWSPDGEWIAFWRTSDVYKIRPDGTDLTRLTFRDGTWDDYMEEVGAWTTDGDWLITSAKINTIDGLYAVPTDGSGTLVPVSIRELACNDWVGSAGDLDFWQLFLPMTFKN